MKVKRWCNDGKGDIIDGNDNLSQVVGQALGPNIAEQMERATQSVKNIADVWTFDKSSDVWKKDKQMIRYNIFEEIKTCLDPGQSTFVNNSVTL